jgi:hypothetical protein
MANLQISDGLNIDNLKNSVYYPGDIIMLNSNTVPTGFLLCDGSTITSIAYPKLFSLLGTYYDTAGLVCKLPNLQQAYWTFPTGTIGNAAAYSAAPSAHTHSANSTVTSGDYNTAAHNHSVGGTSNAGANPHYHGGYSFGGGGGWNGASNVANRSNGSGQGTNLATAGHVHEYTQAGYVNSSTDSHSHDPGFNVASDASNHSHSSSLTTSSSSTTYVPENVISLRYYIKY